MNRKKHDKIFLTGIILFLLPFALSAQRTVSGRITDAVSGEPVFGASVFISGTTVGITSDTTGYYRLKIPGEGSYRLTISHVGYETVFKVIESGKASEVFDIALKMITIEEVTVTAKVRFRKYDIDLFWRTILGQKPSPKTIQVINPESVFYYYNSGNQKLTVTCRVPIQIINNETGYHIQYILNHFTHDYNDNVSSWEGEFFFTEIKPQNYKQKNTWEKNRDKIYRVSIANFIKSLYHDSTVENGFLFIWEHKADFRISETYTEPRLGISSRTTIFKTVEGTTYDVVDCRMFVSIDSITGSKTLYIPSDMDVMLFCYGKPVTGKDMQDVKGQKPFEKIGLFRNQLQTPGEPVRIFPDGTYRNPLWLAQRYSSKSFSGLNLILPVDYSTKDVDSALTNKLVEEILPLDTFTDTLIQVSQRFDQQLFLFPHEKVHLHTDKPYYIAGERIWFRAHVVDAATHIPSFLSGSVFVELFDARDSVVCRVKTGIANDLYSGYMIIPADAPEGDYTLRSWTSRMRNLSEDYFFLKNIRIGDPMSRIVHAQPEFEFLPDQKIGAAIRFSRLFPSTTITPELIKISVNEGKPMNIKSDNGLSSFIFNLSPAERQRVMLLDLRHEKNPFRQYIKIPLPDDDFNVSFYPEGGGALYGCRGRMAVKAMQRDGTEIDVNGIVFDSRGNEMGQFKADVRGMGQFMLTPEKGETYYAVCTTDKGQSKRFDLPAAKETGHALSASWFRDRLMVNVLQPESQKTGDTLCLIVHTRGVVQDVRIWANTSEPIVYPKDFFSSGVTHLLLLTKDMIPVSERLVFALNDDQAIVECTTDQDTYTARSPVAYTVNITDKEGEPLYGNFSVSVTADDVLTADTTVNILTSILLSSDLRGSTPDPAYYFRKNTRSEYALDLLMLTQGWRRYDTERIVRNELIQPDTFLVKGYDVSGTVRTVSRQRPVENSPVSILSMSGLFSEETITDRNGRFYLQAGDAADSTRLFIQTPPTQNRQDVELTLDKPSYPERMIPVVATGAPERETFAQYVDKAEQQYVDEHGTRIIQIEEITVTAQAPKKNIIDYSFFYKARDASFVITEEDLEKLPPVRMSSLLMRLPGVTASYDGVTAGLCNVVLLVDDRHESVDYVLKMMDVSDIAQIDLLSGSIAEIFRKSESFHDEKIFCIRVISIHTKRGKNLIPKETLHIKHLTIPLGFQKPAEFYAPKYDKPAENPKPDLRTTIHWQPNITTNEDGTASFSFYTADEPATYTVVIEGVTEDGKIVYKKDKIKVISHNHH